MTKSKIKSDGRTITVRVPISIRKRGGRKVVLAPDGTVGVSQMFCQQVDNAIIKALARAFRWREMLENAEYATVKEIAEAERIAETYVGRVLRLSLLAPNVVDAILAGRQTPKITLSLLMKKFPIQWRQQEDMFNT